VSRPQVLGTILVIVIGLALLSLVSTRRAAARSADQSLRSLEQAKTWADEIRILGQRSKLTSATSEAPEDIAILVSEQIRQVGLDPTQLVSVDPQPLARKERSNYATRATLVSIRNASLAQLVQFAVLVEGAKAGLKVSQLSITRSPTQPGEELWNVRLTLTQQVLSPISTIP
jgi:cell division septation protein DedD